MSEELDPGSAAGETPQAADPTAMPEATLSARLQERGIPSVNRVRSIQSRVTSALAVGFVCLLSAGLLTWYYARAFHQAAGDPRVRPKTNPRAQTDVGLPPLGHFQPPHLAPAPAATPAPPDPALIARLLGDPPPDPGTLGGHPPAVSVAPRAASAQPASHRKTPEQVALERRLQGAVRSSRTANAGAEAAPSAPDALGETPTAGSAASGAVTPLGEGSAPSQASGVSHTDPTSVRARLATEVVPTVKARVLPTQRFLLPQGAFIDCTLETAIDSTLPGMTTCITATDTFGADGQVVLLERGTKLVGETRGQVLQGQSRVFVLWTQARTPTGVVIPLASPGTDELGRAGLPGQVDRHFWDRFGAALLITVVEGAIQRAATPPTNGGIVTVNPSAAESVLTEILRNTLNIAPTVRKDQGDRIQILVARDVDFRSVYDLRLTARATP